MRKAQANRAADCVCRQPLLVLSLPICAGSLVNFFRFGQSSSISFDSSVFPRLHASYEAPYLLPISQFVLIASFRPSLMHALLCNPGKISSLGRELVTTSYRNRVEMRCFIVSPDQIVYFFEYVTRQILFAPSSVISIEPSFNTNKPTGRPHTSCLSSAIIQPVMKSS